MTFHRMTRTILRENTFPENLMTKFPEIAKKHICNVLQFGTIWSIIKHKSNCVGTLILVKVAGWSAAFLKLTILTQIMQNISNPEKCIFLGCFGFAFFKVSKN